LEERLALQTFDAERTESFLESALPLLRRQQIEREQRELMRKIQEALREGETERASDLMKLRDELFRAAGALQRAKR
jgi:L-fucose isomerase-like protein